MKRKATGRVDSVDLNGSLTLEAKGQSEDVEIRHDADNGLWDVSMSQAAALFCIGCFHLTVTSGTLSIRGSTLTSADGPVPIASYSGNTCFKVQVLARSRGVPLVLARVACSRFTLKAITPDCSVAAALELLPGVGQEPGDAIDDWEQAIEVIVESTENPPKILICGPKKTGKSTLTRRLVNALLVHHDSVNLLEADCGQPQFGPPGFVSMTNVSEPLLLPPPCLLRQPDEMMAIGDVSAESNPITYINTIRKLLESHYGAGSEQHVRPPLVVNTMGWVKGFGLSLLRDITLAALPTHVFSLCSGNPRKDVSANSPWMQEVAQHHNINCVELRCIGATKSCSSVHDTHASTSPGGAMPPKPQAHSATDERNSRLHAWMLATLQARQPDLYREEALLATAIANRLADTAAQLCACPPVVLPLADVQVVPMFEGWSSHNTTAVLNGSLVALVTDGQLPLTVTAGRNIQESMVNNPPKCCGLGLIHAVGPSPLQQIENDVPDPQNFHGSTKDTSTAIAYIHTPASQESMQSVTAVVVGMLEAPAVLMRAPGMCSPYVALNCLASDAGGGGVMRSRRNLVRAGQA